VAFVNSAAEINDLGNITPAQAGGRDPENQARSNAARITSAARFIAVKSAGAFPEDDRAANHFAAPGTIEWDAALRFARSLAEQQFQQSLTFSMPGFARMSGWQHNQCPNGGCNQDQAHNKAPHFRVLAVYSNIRPRSSPDFSACCCGVQQISHRGLEIVHPSPNDLFEKAQKRDKARPNNRPYGDTTIPPLPPRRAMGNQPAPMNGPRYNEFITSQKVRVIDENGENLGVMFTREAREQAEAVGLDLVEISPSADPPVAKLAASNMKHRKKPIWRARTRRFRKSKKSRCAPTSTIMIMIRR
jgi:hypothetical protein